MSELLLTMEDAPKAATAEDAHKPDRRSVYAQEVLGMPAEWEWFEITCCEEDAPKGFFRITGAIAPMMKRKPRRDWPKRDKKSERKLFIAFAEYEAWEEARGERLDECPPCSGTGQVFASWNYLTGTATRDCERCGTSGKYTPAAAVTHG